MCVESGGGGLKWGKGEYIFSGADSAGDVGVVFCLLSLELKNGFL